MIFRDDDINKYADVTTLLRVQEIFDKHSKVHTVTLVMEDLWESRGVWEWLLTTPGLDIALHGWRHRDYSVLSYAEAKVEIDRALSYWRSNVLRMHKERPITVFYPPWNKVSPNLKKACDACGLKVNDSVDPSQVYNLHWWEHIGGRGLDELERVLSGAQSTEE